MKKPFSIENLSPLYEAVQSSGIFPDSKYFPDCTPKTSAATILKAFDAAKTTGKLDLKSFVETHFHPPHEPKTDYESAGKPINEHLENLWGVLTRQPENSDGTLLPLPKPYIVPGGRFREIYYWDSYFTMLGLQVSGRTDIIENMVENFAHLIETYGFIPNGNRSYYLGRSQPPFFSLMVEVLEQSNPEKTGVFQNFLEKEYEFWMAGEPKISTKSAKTNALRRVVRLPDGSILNRYFDDFDTPRPEAYLEDLHIAEKSNRPPEEVFRHIRAAAESGWDFSSRWFADGHDMATIQTTDLVPVDLNCLLYFLEKNLAKNAAAAGDENLSKTYLKKAEKRRASVLEFCWDERAGFFFDYNFREKCSAGIFTLAAVFPLFFEMATAEQAQKVADILEKNFLCPGGLRTTLTKTGQQWDAPNGWAPLQWMAFRGLKNYGHDALAEKIRQNWMATCEKTYAETGKMMEKYNVEAADLKAGGGEYPNQDGFGWTNGVYLTMNYEL